MFHLSWRSLGECLPFINNISNLFYENLTSQITFLFKSLLFSENSYSMIWLTQYIHNNSYGNAIFRSMTSARFLVFFFDVQDEESSSHIFDDTDASATIQTNSVSQPTSDHLSDRPLSNDENRYKVLFTWVVQSSIMGI